MHYIDPQGPHRQNRLPLFSLTDLSYRYPDGTPALKGINLQIYHGDRIALVGRNGSGKTTLARHLNGLIAARQGTIHYQGAPLDTTCLQELRLSVGVLFQDPDDHLFCNTLYDDVAFGPMNQGVPREVVDQLVRENIAAVGLSEQLYKPAHLLSYGQKKRAAFAAIMAMRPEVLILDEPTANLDPRQEKIFSRLLADYQGTLIIIDHDLLFLYDICQRAVVMNQGRIHHDYSFQELVAEPAFLREHGLDFTFRFSCCGRHHQDHSHRHHAQSHEHQGPGVHQPPQRTPTPLLELQHFSFRYPDGTVGLKDLNLIINSGDRIALVGENGAGKSTLASCLLGLYTGSGFFFHHGRKISPGDRNRLWQKIGIVFQNAADQLFCPSCREEVAFGPRRLGVSGAELDHRVEQALATVHLHGFADRVPLNMSGGERKRLAIAAALAMEPELLILDEPTAGLDPQGEELLLAILQGLAMTTVLITHDLFFITQLSQRTVVMHGGTLVRDYTTALFLEDDHLQAINALDYTYKNDCGERIMATISG